MLTPILSSSSGHGISRMTSCVSRSTWTSVRGAISNRSTSLVAASLSRMMYEWSGATRKLRMRTLVVPSLNVNVSRLRRVATSITSICSKVRSRM